jgi:hypothetical protein
MNSVSVRSGVKGIPNSIISRSIVVDFRTWRATTWVARAKPDPELLELADGLLANYKKPEDLIGENGLLKQLTKMLVERALEVEMTDHLGHDKSGAVNNDGANTRMAGPSARCALSHPVSGL